MPDTMSQQELDDFEAAIIEYRKERSKRLSQQILDKNKAALLDEIKVELQELRDNSTLWKRVRAGGQDSYAGLPPAIARIDSLINRIERLK